MYSTFELFSYKIFKDNIYCICCYINNIYIKLSIYKSFVYIKYKYYPNKKKIKITKSIIKIKNRKYFKYSAFDY